MATIGYRSAVADAFGVKVTGFIAYLMWAFIHVAVPGRLGQPARHALHLGARRSGSGTAARHRIITFEGTKKELAEGGYLPSGRPTPVVPLSKTSGAAAPPVAAEPDPAPTLDQAPTPSPAADRR